MSYSMSKARADYRRLRGKNIGFREWARSYFKYTPNLSPKLTRIVRGRA